jgi:MFS family permease
VSPGPQRRRGGLLWHRSFRLLWFGETISGAGTAMAAAGMPLLAVTVLHASTFAVAAITAAAYLPWLVIGLPAGAWVDRLPARPVMIACDAVSALLYASLPVAAWMGVLTTGQVLVVALLAGAASVFFATAYQVLLPSLVAAADLVEGNAKLAGSAAVAAIGGRGAAGLAAEAIGAASALLFNAASFVVSAGCLLGIRAAAAPHRPDTRTTTVRAEITQGVRFIAADPYLRPLTLYGATANLGYTGSTALLVVFLVRVAGFGEAAVGVLLAAGTIGGVLGAVNARRLARRLGTARAMVLSVLTAGVFSLLIPLTGTGPQAACYVAGAAVASAGISVGNIVTGSFRQAYCPPSMLGRVSAGMRFLVFGAIPLGALLAGWLATALGTRNALWIVLAEYALSCAVLLTPAMLSNRDLPSTTAAICPLEEAAAALSSPVTTSGASGRRRRRAPRAGTR